MLSNIGIPGLIMIVVIALIAFGPKKLPEFGKSIGNGLREFKSAASGMLGDEEESKGSKSNPEVIKAEKASSEKEKTESDKVSNLR